MRWKKKEIEVLSCWFTSHSHLVVSCAYEIGRQSPLLAMDDVPVCHFSTLLRLPDQELLLSEFKRRRHGKPPLLQVQEKNPATLFISWTNLSRDGTVHSALGPPASTNHGGVGWRKKRKKSKCQSFPKCFMVCVVCVKLTAKVNSRIHLP